MLICGGSSFAAKFEPPDGRVIHGAGQTRGGFQSYWELMPAANKPLLYLIYTNLDSGLPQLERDLVYFSDRYPDCVPVIGVSWCWDLHPEHHLDKAIAGGEKDAGIRKLAAILRDYGRPAFLCPGYEFNGKSWNGYEPEPFREAWRRFARILREAGASQAALVWTASAMGDPDFAAFQPGDEWVDWWGMNALEEKALEKPWVEGFLKEAVRHKKPVMICEASAIFVGTKGGKVSWSRWFKAFFEAMERHPEIKAFAYINDNWASPEAALPQLASWGDCRIQINSYVSEAYKQELARAKYVHAGPLEELKRAVPDFGAKPSPPAAPQGKPRIELADPGTERFVDYERYGEFEEAGGFDFRYVIKDREGLAKASGEGIDPNRGISANPRYAKVREEGRIRKDAWQNRPHLTGDPEAAYFGWATCGEDFGVRLLNTGIALEEGGQYEHALKAYRAAMILYPRSFGWSSYKKRWTWLVAPQAWGRIVNLTQRHPELGLKLVGTKMKLKIKIGGDWTKNKVALTPGEFVQCAPAERKNPAALKVLERRGGTVAAVRYENGHWGFQVDGKPYVVKGVTYTPTRTGRHLNQWNWMSADENDNGIVDAPFESWIDANRNGKRDADEPVAGDFKILKQMGCNTIRWINEHPLNLDVLRKMHSQYGIRGAICEPFGAYVIHSGATWEEGTDYRNPEHRRNILAAVRKMAEELKDEPWLLCYILGNENNMPADEASQVNATRTNAFLHPEAYASLLNEAAKLIHEIDPNHPVGVGNLGWGMIDVYGEHAPELDFVGVNEYAGWHGFGALFAYVRGVFDRPVLITEYGCDAYWTGKGPDEDWQARYHRGCWEDIETNLPGGAGEGNCAGGIAFEYLDEWWKDNSRTVLKNGKLFDDTFDKQSNEPTIEMAFPDDWSQEEWFGMVGQGDGRFSPFLRQPRKTYYLYRQIWNDQPRVD